MNDKQPVPIAAAILMLIMAGFIQKDYPELAIGGQVLAGVFTLVGLWVTFSGNRVARFVFLLFLIAVAFIVCALAWAALGKLAFGG